MSRSKVFVASCSGCFMHHLCYNMATSATFQESQLSFSSRLLALWDRGTRVPNQKSGGALDDTAMLVME